MVNDNSRRWSLAAAAPSTPAAAMRAVFATDCCSPPRSHCPPIETVKFSVSSRNCDGMNAPLDGQQHGEPVVRGARFVSHRLQQPREGIRGIAVVVDDEDVQRPG